ncbi:nucleotidyltransferase family protein [Thiomicrorhabdus sp. zzn3]|uniref:nucleotidyltransferase family protein n=1 Tax=Thiomicrorhabdus sp. zzn3 TaxID=3039775 RepID=UPI00243732BD|nr:nucleotidyltransferase family protein [Thiomicrorhabdus sp. zzn3]MDG6777618.1 nucleotidyltransferase family protein [Thiomicrorhabdus sp. zzn3]
MQLFDWREVAVKESDDIRTALSVLDRASLQIVLVVADDQTLVGTLTDGDVRRALLRGETLHSPVSLAMNKQPVAGLNTDSETAWRKILLEKALRHLPILDANRKIVGLYYGKQALQKCQNPVVLMLGGMGMRLRPLTETVPKPMLKVGDRPILETIVSHIAEQGFTEFYFCINYLGEQIRAYFGNGERWGIRIHYIEENERLGTAGALSLIEDQPRHPFIVMNGDLLTKVDLRSLLNFHEEHENLATACVREYSQQVPYGVVELEGAAVSQIVEKPVYRYFVNAGIYALSPEALKKVPNNTFYDMPTLIDELLADQENVGGFPITEYWMDIGQMPDFEQAQADYDVHFTKR